MEGGRGPEFSSETKIEKTDKGFSEKRAARILEGKRMDNSQTKKRKPFVLQKQQKVIKRAARGQVSSREKIIAAHEKNAKALIELIKTLGLLAQGSIRQEEQLMVEIRARQKIQEELLNALVLESRGQLTENTLPKELQDLVK